MKCPNFAGNKTISPLRDFSRTTYINGIRELFLQNSTPSIRLTWLFIFLIGVILTVRQLVKVSISYANEETYTYVYSEQLPPTTLGNHTICFPMATIATHLEINCFLVSSIEQYLLDWKQLSFLAPSAPTFVQVCQTPFPLSKTPIFGFRMLNASIFQSLPFHQLTGKPDVDVMRTIHQRLHIKSDNNSNSMLKFLSCSSEYEEIAIQSVFANGIASTNDHYCNVACKTISTSENKEYNILMPLRWDNEDNEEHQYVFVNSFVRLSHFAPEAVYEDVAYLTYFPPPVSQNLNSFIYLKNIKYEIKAEKYSYPNLRRQPCLDPGNRIIPLGQSRLICENDCIQDKHLERFGCRFDESIIRNNAAWKSCNFYHIFDSIRSNLTLDMLSSHCDNGTRTCKRKKNCIKVFNTSLQDNGGTGCRQSLVDWGGAIYKEYRNWKVLKIHECHEKCVTFRFCQEWDLNYKITRESGELTKENVTVFHDNWYMLNFTYAYSLPSSVLVYKEVLKDSWQMFLGKFGGALELYFGATIISLFHIIFYMLQRCFQNEQPEPSENLIEAPDAGTNAAVFMEQRCGRIYSVWKQMKILLDEVYIDGLRELFTRSQLILRLIWTCFFLLCLALMIIQLVQLTVGYIYDGPLTQVILEPVDRTYISDVSICISAPSIENHSSCPTLTTVHDRCEVIKINSTDVQYQYRSALPSTGSSKAILRLTHFSPGIQYDDTAYYITTLPATSSIEGSFLFSMNISYTVNPKKFRFLNQSGSCVEPNGLVFPKGQYHLKCDKDCISKLCLQQYTASMCEHVTEEVCHWSKSALAHCQESCKSQQLCEEWDLSFVFTENRQKLFKISQSKKDQVSLELNLRCSFPENMLVYEETPHQSLVEFIGAFGGLLGLYCGVSVLSLLRIIFKIGQFRHSRRSKTFTLPRGDLDDSVL